MKKILLLLLVVIGTQISNAQSVIYSEDFTSGTTYCPGSTQYDGWGTFRAGLDTGTTVFTEAIIRGSLDTAGISCADAAVVAQIADALRTGTAGTFVCGTNTWAVSGGNSCVTGCAIAGEDIELTVSAAVSPSLCACNDSYTIRPNIGNGNWGGIAGANTCGAATQTMEVEFVTANIPVVACPMDVITDNDPGECGAIVNFADAIAIDVEDGVVVATQTAGPVSGSLFPIGDTTVEFSATDSDGNTGTCTFLVTVNDNEVPVAVCQDITVELDAMGMATIVAADVDGGSSDNCLFTLSADITSFDCSNIGTNDVVLTITDDSGNEAMCTAVVTIEDNTAPVITCIGQPAINTEVEDFEAATIPTGWTSDIAVGVQDWTFGSGDLPTGDDFPSFAAVFDDDAAGSGETNVGTLSSPVYDLSAAISANLSYEVAFQEAGDQEFSVEVWDGAAWVQVAFYDEDLDPDIQAETFDVSAYMNAAFQVRFAYDDLGGWGWHAAIDNFEVSFETTGAPLEVVLDANGMISIDASDLILSVDDSCGTTTTVGIATSSNIMVNGSFETGDFTGWTAIDNPGPFLPWGVYADNTGVGFFDPALPTDGALLAGNGFDGGVGEAILFQDVTLPAGQTATLTWDENLDYNLLDFCNGCSNRIYEVQVRDLSDNVLEVLTGVTATAGVLENDNAWVSQTADLSAYAGQDIRIAYWQSMPDENSGPAKFALDNVALNVDGISQNGMIDFDCSNIGENQVEVTVTDAGGNTATCIATVTVSDETAPVLVCADATIELGEDGTATIDPEALLAQMPGTFDVITISSDNQSGAVGNTDFTVAVTADETVSFDWDYSTDDGAAFDQFGYLVNGVYTQLTDAAGANNQSGNATVTLVTGDVFGFRSSSEDGLFGAATTVISNFMPGFTGQFDPANWALDLDNSDGDAFFVEIPGGPLSFDACGITTLAVDVTEVTCADIGTPITVTVFASDASGNIAACTAIVTVVDTLGPVIACPADQTVDPGEGNLFYEVPDYFATGEATVTDNCTDPVTITSQDPAVGELISDGVYTVTLTAEDEYGNTSECSFELTVESILGLDDNQLDSAISMYPNPTQSNVTISNSSNIALDKAAIYDTNGRLINTTDLSEMQQEKTIDVSNLATGVYMVQIQGENAITVKRLIKE